MTAQQQADKDQHRRDEQSHLQARPQRDGQAEFHLILEGDLYCYQMLGDIADQRHDDDTDEEFAQAERDSDMLNRADQGLAHEDNRECGNHQHSGCNRDAPFGFMLIFVAGGWRCRGTYRIGRMIGFG